MDNEKFDQYINTFLDKFNEMCKSERRDFLIRERVVTYESGSRIRTYHVTHQLKRKNDNTWVIEGITKGWWIFKSKFLLLRVTRKKNKVNLSGPYTSKIKDFNSSELEVKLNEYLETCKKIPREAFVRS